LPARAAGEEIPPALSPSEALLAFRLKPGLKVELVASEPLIESPVAIDFGADGRLWVCEMYDYPTGIDGRWTPRGVIKVLEGRDGDGRYDHATRFLEGLPFPTGVMAWRQGALVCAAPEILYAEDGTAEDLGSRAKPPRATRIGVLDVLVGHGRGSPRRRTRSGFPPPVPMLMLATLSRV
jgi:hypothetical protein